MTFTPQMNIVDKTFMDNRAIDVCGLALCHGIP